MEETGSKDYVFLCRIGEGSFGKVSMALHAKSADFVAIKYAKLHPKESVEITGKRVEKEVAVLQGLQHENVVELRDTFVVSQIRCLVFDYIGRNMKETIKDPNVQFTPIVIQSYAKMILQGLAYLHSHRIMHCDVKPDNMLINGQGLLKIADFGLAERFGNTGGIKRYRNFMARAYKPPEVLMMADFVGPPIDIWGAALTLIEMANRTVLFGKVPTKDLLNVIYDVVGTPTLANWPEGLSLLERMDLRFEEREGEALEEILPLVHHGLAQLLKHILVLNPSKRSTCQDALKLGYFSTNPLKRKPSLEERSALTAKSKRTRKSTASKKD